MSRFCMAAWALFFGIQLPLQAQQFVKRDIDPYTGPDGIVVLKVVDLNGDQLPDPIVATSSGKIVAYALEDEERFVRKLAWEALKEASGRKYRFPWDNDTTERARKRATKRWQTWWEKEKKRQAAAEKLDRQAEDD